MATPKRFSITVRGKVQGVGFRHFAREIAERLGITGWVRNGFSGEVEIEAQGSVSQLQSFLEEIRMGPLTGQVSGITNTEIPTDVWEEDFAILH